MVQRGAGASRRLLPTVYVCMRVLPPTPVVQGMVRRCLAADPAQRPTARQLLAELEAVLAGGAHVLDAPCEAAPSSGGHLEAPGVPQSPPAVWCALDPSNSRMLHQLFSP